MEVVHRAVKDLCCEAFRLDVSGLARADKGAAL